MTSKTTPRKTVQRPAQKTAPKAEPKIAPKAVKAVKAATKAPAKAAASAKNAAAKSTAASAKKPAAPAPSAAPKAKHKLVRDSFTIPKAEYAVLESLKLRAANLKRPTKKSELLRAGVAALNAMNDQAFLAAVSGVPSLKTGRPKQQEPAGAKPGK